MQGRSVWGSKLGFLLAAIGSAVGLGNVWRFSYVSYQNGGGAFLVPYLAALLTAGIPLMILEYGLGHREKASPPLAFARIHHLWEPFGWWMPIVAFFGINLFYAVVIGWCFNYFLLALNLGWGTDTNAFFFAEFLQISSGPFDLGGIRWPILAGAAFTWFICWFICFREVRHGIEKASLFFMPILVVMTALLVVWSLQLDGAMDAVRKHYLHFDWSKISLATAAGRRVWVAAYGQIFFTLSLGFGIMITYSSYLPKRSDITSNAIITCLVDCFYSIFAGLAVFGTIGYMAQAKGVPFDEAITGGPGLAFVVYPEAINQLPWGNRLFGAIFFLVLIIAGISSAISLTEAFACSLCDKFNFSRKRTISWLCLVGLAGSVIFTTRAGLYILDIVDHFVSDYALILGGILECMLVGWLLKASAMRKHIFAVSGRRVWPVWDIAICVVTPVMLMLILVGAIYQEFSRAYEGYPVGALLLFGGGTLLLSRLGAFVLSHVSWPYQKRKHAHTPDEETLLT
ncbi:MAG: sodium-dependent transporter [Kiritimatiellia bacterium]